MIIGMDFGTTNSGVSVYDGQHIKFLPIDPSRPNSSIARTALYLTNDRQVYIGRDAIDTYFEQNLNRPVQMGRVRVGEVKMTFAELPEFIRDVYVEKDLLAPGRLFLSFKMALPSLNYLGTVVGSHFYFLEDIVALYLFIAKQKAEAQLDQDIKRIVLGRPVHYSFKAEEDQLAQERMLKAAFRAGFDEVYLQYEPIAAAHHYEMGIDRAQNVLIFDFGGGTLDVSIIRVGDPKRREVLANDGVPIAGDVFDRKLVRAKIPPHFGEGMTYRSGGKDLPVPSSFYEAFGNWQEMLNLQRPEILEDIQRIERQISNPRPIRALRHLISSSYGLKMFDIVEATKRQLSDSLRASVKLSGEGFSVYEKITRSEFERIIRSETRIISEFLDTMLNKAGLKNSDIDAVIRTGGSSQIPVFVNMLEERFGADKVGDMDTFNGVTSGLGIIANQLERGELDLPVHRREDYLQDDSFEQDSVNGVPSVDFEVMKKFIELTQTRSRQSDEIGLIAMTAKRDVFATHYKSEAFAANETVRQTLFDKDQTLEWVRAVPLDDRVLLLTSDYRFTVQTARHLSKLNSLGLDLAEAEGYATDVFGDEHVTGFTHWTPLQSGTKFMLISSSGYYKTFTEGLTARIDQVVTYQPERLRGYPVTILDISDPESEIWLFTDKGRALRFPVARIGENTGRLMRVSTSDAIITAFTRKENGAYLMASRDGRINRIETDDVEMMYELNTTGSKVFTRKNLCSITSLDNTSQIWGVFSTRIVPVDTEQITPDEPTRITRLRKNEYLISLIAPPISTPSAVPLTKLNS